MSLGRLTARDFPRSVLDVLDAERLSQFADALAELGVDDPCDLEHVNKEDLPDITEIQWRRFSKLRDRLTHERAEKPKPELVVPKPAVPKQSCKPSAAPGAVESDASRSAMSVVVLCASAATAASTRADAKHKAASSIECGGRVPAKRSRSRWRPSPSPVSRAARSVSGRRRRCGRSREASCGGRKRRSEESRSPCRTHRTRGRSRSRGRRSCSRAGSRRRRTRSQDRWGTKRSEAQRQPIGKVVADCRREAGGASGGERSSRTHRKDYVRHCDRSKHCASGSSKLSQDWRLPTPQEVGTSTPHWRDVAPAPDVGALASGGIVAASLAVEQVGKNGPNLVTSAGPAASAGPSTGGAGNTGDVGVASAVSAGAVAQAVLPLPEVAHPAEALRAAQTTPKLVNASRIAGRLDAECEFYVRYYVSHTGTYGHEFLEFELRPDGRLRYANSSNYSRELNIRRETNLTQETMNVLRNIIFKSEILKEDDSHWPAPDRMGRQELEVVAGKEHICFATSKIGFLADVQASKDPEGLSVFYYLVQDLKTFVFSLISFHFRIKPV